MDKNKLFYDELMRSTDWNFFAENNQCNLIRLDFTDHPVKETWYCLEGIEIIKLHANGTQDEPKYLDFWSITSFLMIITCFVMWYLIVENIKNSKR